MESLADVLEEVVLVDVVVIYRKTRAAAAVVLLLGFRSRPTFDLSDPSQFQVLRGVVSSLHQNLPMDANHYHTSGHKNKY